MYSHKSIKSKKIISPIQRLKRHQWMIIIVIILPITYVWTLPLLHDWLPKIINVGDVLNDGCKSISSYITLTPGTGIMSLLMFFPLQLMWESQIVTRQGHKRQKIINHGAFWTLLLFQLNFGLFLSLPINYNRELHFIVVGLFCLMGILHFSVILYSKINSSKLIIFLVIIGIIAFGLTSVVSYYHSGLILWVSECVGLSSMISISPVLMIQEDKRKDAMQRSIKRFQTQTTRKIGKPNTFIHSFFIILGTILPTAYIWFLPYFSGNGYANHHNEDGTQTISCYISNTQATGAMAGVFFFPIFLMWDSTIQHKKNKFIGSIPLSPLLAFTLTFYFFLIVNEREYIYVHYFCYAAFYICALVHYLTMKKYKYYNVVSQVILGITILGIITLLTLATLAQIWKFIYGSYFWVIESITLTAMIWYTPSLVLDKRMYEKKQIVSTCSDIDENEEIKWENKNGLQMGLLDNGMDIGEEVLRESKKIKKSREI